MRLPLRCCQRPRRVVARRQGGSLQLGGARGGRRAAEPRPSRAQRRPRASPSARTRMRRGQSRPRRRRPPLQQKLLLQQVGVGETHPDAPPGPCPRPLKCCYGDRATPPAQTQRRPWGPPLRRYGDPQMRWAETCTRRPGAQPLRLAALLPAPPRRSPCSLRAAQAAPYARACVRGAQVGGQPRQMMGWQQPAAVAAQLWGAQGQRPRPSSGCPLARVLRAPGCGQHSPHPAAAAAPPR